MMTVTVTITLPAYGGSAQDYASALLNASSDYSVRGDTIASHALAQLSFYASCAAPAVSHNWPRFDVFEPT